MDKATLQCYIEGRLGQQQKEDVARWLDADEKNRQEYLLLRGIYDVTLWNDPAPLPSLARRKQAGIRRELLKIAAIFLLAFGCFYFFVPEKKGVVEQAIVMQTVYVPEGQRAEILLADGTQVWLNAKTSLSFPTRFAAGERRVELNGEAFFKVEKDSLRHFIVATDNYRIKVLGTEFDVKAYRQHNYFETSLLKGSVEVLSNRTHEKVTLTPNTFVYADNDRLIRKTLHNTDRFLWKEGIIAFEKESVKEIFGKLELYFDVRIKVENTRILNFPYTGKFRTKDGVEHVLRVLQLRHKFTYTKDNETNTIVIR